MIEALDRMRGGQHGSKMTTELRETAELRKTYSDLRVRLDAERDRDEAHITAAQENLRRIEKDLLCNRGEASGCSTTANEALRRTQARAAKPRAEWVVVDVESSHDTSLNDWRNVAKSMSVLPVPRTVVSRINQRHPSATNTTSARSLL
jgi:hypothetical protein